MGLIEFIETLLAGSLAHAWLVPFAIVIATLLLEDGTTVLVGVLAADGLVGVPVALASLYIGIILGDFGLYGFGYLAADHRWARRFVHHERYESTRAWLEERFESAVFTSRFVPGLRIPTFTAAGFFRFPFRRFVPPVVFGTLVWSSLFFTGAYAFGHVTEELLGAWRWPVALGIVLAWFAFNRWRLSRRASKRLARTPAPVSASEA